MQNLEVSHSHVKSVIQKANGFQQKYSNDPAIKNTFGYFTRHPVAPLNQRRLQLLSEIAEQQSRELGRALRILDLGCGGGIISSSMALLGHQALGFDLCEQEIKMAKLFTEEEKIDARFQQVDLIKNLNWEKEAEAILGGKPDLIILAYALHHFPEVDLVVERLSQWLDSDSILLINEENPQSPLFRLKHRIRTWIQKDTDVEWHRSFHGWSTLLHRSGFRTKDPLYGVDFIPGLKKIAPERCWSLIFTAQLAKVPY